MFLYYSSKIAMKYTRTICALLIFCLNINICVSYKSSAEILKFRPLKRVAQYLDKGLQRLAHHRHHDDDHHHGLRLDPEIHMNVSQIITSEGYPCKQYTVKTKDGFFLSVQRIPHGRKMSPGKRPVVFLQHGLLCSSTDWVVNLANESLAFILADAGFDVWLGNNRGNTYSQQHESLKPSQDEFWAWSWDELAQYDFPAQIDFALQTSGQKELYYVGHSQGTTQAFAHLSENPDMAPKIKAFFALAPVALLRNTQTPVRYFRFLPDTIIYWILGRKDFLPKNRLFDFLADTVCVDRDTRELCSDYLFLITGYDIRNMNQSRLPVYINHTPAGSSVRDIVHFLQQMRSGLFQKYDYGCSAMNKKHYNQTTPPMYDVNKLTTSLYIFSGQNDWLADPKDVAHLKAQLTRGQIKASHEIPMWNHLDFIWGLDAARLVYHDIVSIIKQHL